jgi:hypothetical protein
MFERRVVRLATVAAAVLGLAAGIAYAAIPDPDGKIHACFDNKGVLRVIDPAVSGCGAKETPITLHPFSGTPAGGDLAGNYSKPEHCEQGSHAEQARDRARRSRHEYGTDQKSDSSPSLEMTWVGLT